MKKIICILTVVSSTLIADVPSAGRPNPGAFEDESVPILEQISKNITEMKEGILDLKNIREEIINVRKSLDRLIWYLDHNVYEENYHIK